MAIIKLMGAGPHHDFAVSGTEITIGTIKVDAAAQQGDGAVVVDVYVKKDGSFSQKGPGAFAGHVAIPGRRYREEPGTDGEGKPTINRIPEDIAANAVEVTIWPKP